MSRRSSNRSSRLSPQKNKNSRPDSFEPKGSKEIAKPVREMPDHIVGVVTQTNTGWTLIPTDRHIKDEFLIKNTEGIVEHKDELAVANVLNGGRSGRRFINVSKYLGSKDDPRNLSLIAIHQHGIPTFFSEKAVAEANAAQPVTLKGRVDLRKIPLVTIDGEDARDFDDAVFAERDKDGWHLIVAIADVAHYVTPHSALNTDALERGNSTYMVDRVVPMLPEALSNELCSLKPNVDRACMAVHLYIDTNGELKNFKFERGVMRSVARLTYTQVQAAFDGKLDDTTRPLMDDVIGPLRAAYKSLKKASERRGTMNLNLPERRVVLGDDGDVVDIKFRESKESNKLIEEFMIAANVAAARQLKGTKKCMYRIHDAPDERKLETLREFLKPLGYSIGPSKEIKPKFLNQILDKVKDTPHEQVVNEMMLRSMAQAVYSPDNIGHFGLALTDYAHFTSPIRRYSDLLVHRALIDSCHFGKDGMSEGETKALIELGQHISMTERRSMAAERDTLDRFSMRYLEKHLGETFDGRIKSVTKSGLFVRLTACGADGFLPFFGLPKDRYDFDEKRQQVEGRETGRIFQLGQNVMVKIEEIEPLTGSARFKTVEEKAEKDRHNLKPRRPASEKQGKFTKQDKAKWSASKG